MMRTRATSTAPRRWSEASTSALPHQPVSRASCVITFRVRVNDDAEPGSIIRNTAQVTSTEQAEFSTNQVQTQIAHSSLGTPCFGSPI